jgi:hypothetical protein
MIKSGRSREEVDATRRLLSQAVPLVAESQALSYALIMAFASTPREEFTREEIDALCQLAWELQHKLSRAVDLLQDADKVRNA